MVRSAAIAWTIGLAAAALALPIWPAQADDKPAEKAETRPQPLEPKAVRVILLPPADDSVFTSRNSELGEGAPVILLKPSGNDAIDQSSPEPMDAETASIMMQSAGSAAIAQQRPVSAAIEPDAAPVEDPSLPDRRPRVAVLPPVSDAAIASPRPERAKPEKATPSVAIPSLPGRSPFRQAPFKSEVVETAATFPQEAPQAAPAKSNSPFRFLTNLWPGNKQASTPAAPSGDGKAVSASTPVRQDPAETAPNGDKPKRFIDVIQFWKN